MGKSLLFTATACDAKLGQEGKFEKIWCLCDPQDGAGFSQTRFFLKKN
jgi:hypothetical protein